MIELKNINGINTDIKVVVKPNISCIVLYKSPLPLVLNICLSSLIIVNDISGCDKAIFSTKPTIWDSSVCKLFINFNLAGVL